MGKVIRNIVIVVLVLVVLIGAVSALVVTRENEYTMRSAPWWSPGRMNTPSSASSAGW